MGSSEHFRTIRRHKVTTYPHVLAVRVDESLYFANARYLEDVLLGAMADQPEVKHLVLICSAVQPINTSALETLEHLIADLREAGVSFYLAEVEGSVLDSKAIQCSVFSPFAKGGTAPRPENSMTLTES